MSKSCNALSFHGYVSPFLMCFFPDEFNNNEKEFHLPAGLKGLTTTSTGVTVGGVTTTTNPAITSAANLQFPTDDSMSQISRALRTSTAAAAAAAAATSRGGGGAGGGGTTTDLGETSDTSVIDFNIINDDMKYRNLENMYKKGQTPFRLYVRFGQEKKGDLKSELWVWTQGCPFTFLP